MLKYSKEQILQLYKTLPDELKEAINAEQTTDIIEETSNKYNLSDAQTTALVNSISEVLMGLLPPDEFQAKLESVGMESNDAKNMRLSINRFVFYPVRQALDALYKTQISVPGAVDQTSPEQKSREREAPKKQDTYRETFD